MDKLIENLKDLRDTEGKQAVTDKITDWLSALEEICEATNGGPGWSQRNMTHVVCCQLRVQIYGAFRAVIVPEESAV